MAGVAGTVVAIVSGGNVEPDRYRALSRGARTPPVSGRSAGRSPLASRTSVAAPDASRAARTSSRSRIAERSASTAIG